MYGFGMNKGRQGGQDGTNSGDKDQYPKYSVPSSPLQQELKNPNMEPLQTYYNDQLHNNMLVKIQQVAKKYGPESEELRSWINRKVQFEFLNYSEKTSALVKSQFVGEFIKWLLGKSHYNRKKDRTPWGQKRLVGKSI